MIAHISVSQINLYLACSLKYRFRYIDQVEPSFKPAALAFGSAIHKALEWIHTERMHGRPVDPDRVLQIFGADWHALQMEEILYKNGESGESLVSLGESMLRAYLDQAGTAEIKAVEMVFEVPLVDSETGEMMPETLKGIIDLVEADDTIVDFKTVARRMSDMDLRTNLQMTAYSYAYQTLTGKQPNLRMDMLYKSKTAKIERLPTFRSVHDHRKLFYLAKEVTKGIKAGIFFPNPSWRCTDCEFQHVCWLWQGKLPRGG